MTGSSLQGRRGCSTAVKVAEPESCHVAGHCDAVQTLRAEIGGVVAARPFGDGDLRPADPLLDPKVSGSEMADSPESFAIHNADGGNGVTAKLKPNVVKSEDCEN